MDVLIRQLKRGKCSNDDTNLPWKIVLLSELENSLKTAAVDVDAVAIKMSPKQMSESSTVYIFYLRYQNLYRLITADCISVVNCLLWQW